MTEAPRPKPDAATGACPTCGYALCDSRECEPPSAPAGAPEPVPMHLECPKCGTVHVDTWDDAGTDWAVRPHKTHLCLHCGNLWKPFEFPTVGVAAGAPEASGVISLDTAAERIVAAARAANCAVSYSLESLTHTPEAANCRRCRWEGGCKRAESAESESDRLRAQLQAAEAQIAAVRAVVADIPESVFTAAEVGMLDEEYAIEAVGDLRIIRALLTPATSPGAGGGK